MRVKWHYQTQLEEAGRLKGASAGGSLKSLYYFTVLSRRAQAQKDVAWMKEETKRLMTMEKQREAEIDDLYR